MDPRNSYFYSLVQTIPHVDRHAVPLLQRSFYGYNPDFLNAHYHGYRHGYGDGIGIPRVQEDYGFFNVPQQQGFWNYSPLLLQQQGRDYGIHDVAFPYYHPIPSYGSGTWLQQGPVNWEYLSQHYGYVPCQQNYVPWEVLSEEENHIPEENSLDDLASEDGIENSQAWEDYQVEDSWFDQTENYPPLEDRASGDEVENFQAWEDHTEYQSPWEDMHPDDQIENQIHLDDDGSVIFGPFHIRRVNFYISVPQDEVNEGLREDTILKNLKSRTYVKECNSGTNSHSDEPEICVICQLEYEDKETLGILGCGHEYHAECIKRWLLQKNICPLCKETALQE